MSTHARVGLRLLGLFISCPFIVGADPSCEARGTTSTATSGSVLLAIKHNVTRTGGEAGVASSTVREYDSDGDDNFIDNLDDSSAALELSDTVEEREHGSRLLDAHEQRNRYSVEDDASFRPEVWNSAPEIRASHNCYMYALNDLSPQNMARCKDVLSYDDDGHLSATGKADMPKICRKYFHKPGYYFQNVASGGVNTDVWFKEETSCRLMLPMIAADSPNIVWHNEHNTSLTETDACPQNHYMASLVIAPKAGWHFYRRDSRCKDNSKEWCWSHKPGTMKATDLDASGKKIHSVLQADRNYGDLDYSQHCAFFCVPQNGFARTNSDSRKKSSQHH